MATKKIGTKYACGNLDCEAVPSGLMLKACYCKGVRYCSRTCQKIHWKSHQDTCKDNQTRMVEIAKARVAWKNLDLIEEKLRLWAKFHSLTLLAAMVHALDLPTDIRRTETHVLRLRVKRRVDVIKLSESSEVSLEDNDANDVEQSKAEMNIPPEISFEIEDANVVEQSRARHLGPLWVVGLDRLADVREQSEFAGKGAVGAIAIECEPFEVYFMPFGSLKNLDTAGVSVLHGCWKEVLKEKVLDGSRFVTFLGPREDGPLQ